MPWARRWCQFLQGASNSSNPCIRELLSLHSSSRWSPTAEIVGCTSQQRRCGASTNYDFLQNWRYDRFVKTRIEAIHKKTSSPRILNLSSVTKFKQFHDIRQVTFTQNNFEQLNTRASTGWRLATSRVGCIWEPHGNFEAFPWKGSKYKFDDRCKLLSTYSTRRLGIFRWSAFQKICTRIFKAISVFSLLMTTCSMIESLATQL